MREVGSSQRAGGRDSHCCMMLIAVLAVGGCNRPLTPPVMVAAGSGTGVSGAGGGSGGAAGAGAVAPQPISFLSLLAEMTNRDLLAVHPRAHAPHKCLQASSYDRGSTAPDQPGWFANQDWSWYIRDEMNQGRREWVLLDAPGPGALTRYWTTFGSGSETGTLRFYLDGSTTPFWAGKATERVGINPEMGWPLSSRTVDRDPLQGGQAHPGHNLYAPIPYAKSLKITYDVPPGNRSSSFRLWYNINYRSYGPGIQVQSFDPSALADPAVAAKLAETNAQLSSPDTAPRGLGNRQLRTSGLLASAQALEQPLAGAGAIRRLRLTLQAGDQAAALRHTLLELGFDGRQTARVPVGLFFGTGSKRFAPLHEWYRTVDPATGQMTVYWTMPYQANANVRVVNSGDQPVQVDLEVETGAWSWTRDSMHFHAAYREDLRLPTVGAQGKDWNYVTIQGRGVYVGDTLEVSKSARSWWGEGDEKIFVDGEAFPSHFGTGTEDYYGYAWGHTETFSQPFISQPLGDANQASGTTVNSRTRALDGIPFDQSLKVDMEVWNWHGGPVDYSVATFWYQIP